MRNRLVTRSLGFVFFTVVMGVSLAHARTIRVEPIATAASDVTPDRSETSPQSLADRAGTSGLVPVCAEAVLGTVRYELCLPSSVFEFGEPVVMEYKITNEGSEAVRFDFNTTCQEFFAITPDPCPQDCSLIWPDSPTCFFMTSELVVEPGETRTFVKQWRHHTKDGWRTRSGLYLARAELLEHESTRLEVPFEVVPYGPEPIQDALDVASDGDVVLVAPGTYYENLLLLSPQRGVVLRSEAGPEVTILDGGERGSVLYLGQLDNQTLVEGFTIQNGREAEDLGANAYLGGGISIFSAASLRNNHLRDNESDYGGAVAIEASASPQLEDHLFLRNTASADGGAIFSRGNPVIERSTFAKNDAARGAGVFDNGLSNRVRTLNCVFYANMAEIEGGAVFCQSDSPPTGTYCHIYWENVPDDRADCVPGNFQLTVDPKFCAADSDDYHLQDTSPATEANSPCGRIGAFDIGCATTQVPGEMDSLDPWSVRAQPNPFREVVEIATRSGDTRFTGLEVLDASGRRVWEWRSTSTQTPTFVRWTGIDTEGREVPAGVFFLRTWSDQGASETVPLVRIR